MGDGPQPSWLFRTVTSQWDEDQKESRAEPPGSLTVPCGDFAVFEAGGPACEWGWGSPKGLGARETLDLEQAQVGPTEFMGQVWVWGTGWAVLRDTQPRVSGRAACVRVGGSVSLCLTPKQQRPPFRACRNEATLQVTPLPGLFVHLGHKPRTFFSKLSLGQTLNQMVQ